jgi:PKD repeat protein
MLSGFKKYRLVALLLAACLLTLAQCKRSEEPFNNIGKPVFALKGTVNGQSFSKTAGVNGYYMYSSYQYDSANKAFTFSANMAGDSCPTCKETLQITFYDKATSNSATPVNITAALPLGSYSFFDSIPVFKTRYKYNFIAEGRYYTNPTYLWTFNGTDTSRLQNPIVYFTDTSTKTVCLTITDSTTLCNKTICNAVYLPLNPAYDYVKANFDYDTLGGLNIQFLDKSAKPPGTTYNWDFGDGNQSIDSIPTHLYSSTGRYLVKLRINGVFGIRAISKYVDVKNVSLDCLTNYSYESPVADSVIVGTQSPLSKIIVRYTDDNGEEFISSRQSQPLTSQFTVIGNTLYNNNERGEKTSALNVNFRCRVFSTSTNNFKDLVITNGQIAVAYP